MGEHNAAPVRIILMCLAIVLFFLGAVAWREPWGPNRPSMISAGLFCWSLSTFF